MSISFEPKEYTGYDRIVYINKRYDYLLRIPAFRVRLNFRIKLRLTVNLSMLGQGPDRCNYYDIIFTRLSKNNNDSNKF